MLCSGPQAPAIVISVLTTVSMASGLFFLIGSTLTSPKLGNLMGTVALTPVPTMIPATTRELGRDFTVYAKEASVAIVSLVMAVIFRRGNGPNFLRFALGDELVGDCRRVCRA